MVKGFDEERFKQVLDQSHAWPCGYAFKFVVPKRSENDLRALFPAADITRRISSAGRYVSLTAKQTISSAQEVVALYQAAAAVENIIIL